MPLAESELEAQPSPARPSQSCRCPVQVFGTQPKSCSHSLAAVELSGRSRSRREWGCSAIGVAGFRTVSSRRRLEKPCLLEESPSFFPLPIPSPQPARRWPGSFRREAAHPLLAVSAPHPVNLIFPLTTAPILASAGLRAPSRSIPQAAQLPFVRDERSVRPVLRATPSLAMPRLQVVAERSALTPASTMTLAPQAASRRAEPVSAGPLEVRAAPVQRGLPPMDLVVSGTAPLQSHRPCLEPRVLSVDVQRDAVAGKPMQGAGWSFTPAAPQLEAACTPSDVTARRSAAANLHAPALAAAPAPAARSNESQRLDFSVPKPRLLGLGSLVPRLALRRLEALQREVRGLDVAPCPVSGIEAPAPMGNSMLPALASLFRYGKPVQRISPMPLVGEGLAAQNRPARPLAYAALPIRPPLPVLLDGRFPAHY